ncbi:MAG TPA: lipopolysaccharide assembly protein LapA domain-containing protein [Nocardioidaceae bacterium]
MTPAPTQNTQGQTSRRVSGRTVAGGAAAVLLVVWILVNRDTVDVSFVIWSAQLPLWIALAIAGLLGAAACYLLGRRRRGRPSA